MRIRKLTAHDPAVALYMMLQTATGEIDNYSAKHAMFCAVVADLCATYFDWPGAEAVALHNAALTMNIGMLLMQNAMASRPVPFRPLRSCTFRIIAPRAWNCSRPPQSTTRSGSRAAGLPRV